MNKQKNTLTDAIIKGFDCTGRSDVEIAQSVEASVKAFLRNQFQIAFLRADLVSPEFSPALFLELLKLSKALDLAGGQIQTKDESRGVGA